MSDVTLSSAVRSNLLNLQNTAKLMGKTQERLATGLKVNSALDNPTNFFTASSLNSRASDLGALLDSVSNAVQTIAAADKGISSLTKLVESAQATARQALQTAATLAATPAVTASVASGNTTSVTIAADVTAGPATAATGDISSLTIGTGTPEVLASADTGDLSALNATGGTITINGEDVVIAGGDGAAETLTALQAAATAAGTFTVTDNGDDTFTIEATTGEDLVIGGDATTLTELGLTAGTTNNTPATADTTGDITINGQTVSLADTDDAAAILTKLQAAATASSGADEFTVSEDAGVITISAADGNNLTIGGANTAGLAALGLTAGTTNPTAAADNSAGAVTVNGQTINLAGGDDAADILAAFQAAATASSGTDAFTVSNASGVLTLTGTNGNDIVIGGDAATLTALGLTAGTTEGTPAAAAAPNPKRDELRVEFNNLLTQIDQLSKDTGFNGVNLLNGDDLSVLFNEDGTSKLDVTGVTFDSAGLGLTAAASGGFDTNAGINATLDTLKDAISTLRTQASKFGSNLSVVETRQDFTKNMINVLETGAANLTLADTNEEAANLLALQTRQQLSTTALSLASQGDQNVLRLF